MEIHHFMELQDVPTFIDIVWPLVRRDEPESWASPLLCRFTGFIRHGLVGKSTLRSGKIRSSTDSFSLGIKPCNLKSGEAQDSMHFRTWALHLAN